MTADDSDAPDFIGCLSRALSGNPLREKILLAPSLRVGRQWLDQAASRAGGLANCRAATARRLAMDLASPVLRRRGLNPASRQEKTRLIGLALASLKEGGGGYFSRLPPSLAMAEVILDAIEEVEQVMPDRAGAGLKYAAPPEKTRELNRLIREYHSGLAKNGLAGTGTVLVAALSAARESNQNRPLLVMPEPVACDMAPGEMEIFTAWPDGDRLFIPEPPRPVGNKPEVFMADAVMNEAREVFRRLQALGIPLERAEAVCLDEDAYVPALCAAAREAFGGGLEELPVTCAQGLPAGSSRPARLLLSWLEWRRTGLPPEGLARMASSGLMDGIWRGDCPGLDGWEVAARLRSLPLTGDPEDYLRVLGGGRGRGDKPPIATALVGLAELLKKVMPAAWPEGKDGGNAPRALQAARELLILPDPGAGKLDAYAAAALLDSVNCWLPHSDWSGFDAWSWLSGLASGLRVMGMGPSPGRLHVGGLFSGGHSGREVVFVLGLDDSRFPGHPRQNPVLADRERAGLSPHLRTAGHWPRRRETELGRLLSRRWKRIFVSCSRRECGVGQELFPALFLQKIHSGSSAAPEGEATASLIPDAPEKRLNRRDDWLGALLAENRGRVEPAALAPWFPRLFQGETALAARASNAFTEYDGRVPEAGKDFLARDEALSPTDLELLAACPLEFFFTRVLGIRPPARSETQPGRWLPGAERGNLLHRVFQEFAEKTRGEKPEAEKWRPILAGALSKALKKAGREFPAADDLARLREERTLKEACDIFLAEELRRRREGGPIWLELSLGKSQGGDPPWNRAGSIVMEFSGGRRIKLKGRVDRVDRLKAGGLRLIDYKTGRADKFSSADPFRQGRQLQPCLYSWMLEESLRGLGLPDTVREFSYFFPMPRDEGGAGTAYRREDLLPAGLGLAERLFSLLAAGVFPFTVDAEDVAYSDFAPVYGDAGKLAENSRDKTADPALADWAELRGRPC